MCWGKAWAFRDSEDSTREEAPRDPRGWQCPKQNAMEEKRVSSSFSPWDEQPQELSPGLGAPA